MSGAPRPVSSGNIPSASGNAEAQRASTDAEQRTDRAAGFQFLTFMGMPIHNGDGQQVGVGNFVRMPNDDVCILTVGRVFKQQTQRYALRGDRFLLPFDAACPQSDTNSAVCVPLGKYNANKWPPVDLRR